MTDVDRALAEVRRRAAGRTRYEGQPRPADEVLAEEVAALRAKVRALSAPLASDPDGRMWSTLNYFASREDDDLDTEVMAWAMSEITGLRTRVAELEAALRGMVTLFHAESDDVDEFPEYRAARRALGADHG